MKRPAESATQLPTIDDIERVETAVLENAAMSGFVNRAIRQDGFEPAAVELVRRLLQVGHVRRARSIAQVFRANAGTRAMGDVCFALVTMHEPVYETAWQLFSRNDPAFVLRLAPREYFVAGFQVAPAEALDVLARVINREIAMRAPAHLWLEIATGAFVLGAEDLADRVLKRAERRNATRLKPEIEALRSWFGRRATASAPVEMAPGTIPFAVTDYRMPGQLPGPIRDDEALATLAALGNLVRRRNLRFVGAPRLVPLANRLGRRVPQARQVDGPETTVRLFRVDRDATSFTAVPDGTWFVVSGFIAKVQARLHFDLPYNSRLRPLFIGVEVGEAVLSVDGMVEYLRDHGPIGCRDWRSVSVLHAAGVPAFFSGWVTATLDNLSAPDPDKTAPAPGIERNLVNLLDKTIARRGARNARTRRLFAHVAGRAVGARVVFDPPKKGDGLQEDVVGISDEEFDAMRTRVRDLFDAVLAPILAGDGDGEVYARWREATAPLVEQARARHAAVGGLPVLTIDIEPVVRAIRESAVVVERTEQMAADGEINVEFSLDENYKHQLDVVLDSIVTRTSRPIRAFVLCRGHGRDDFARMARLFPTVSFVWLQTDKADYGPIRNMLRHITVTTMDRLLLPDLLPDVDRIIHHDLDALCLADLGELYDIDLGDSPLAARDQRHPFRGSGYVSMMRAAANARTVELSRELMKLITSRHPFDFRTLNAGIMVLNLARMRADGFIRNFLPLVEHYGFNDQDVLNVYAGTQRHDLERAWNVYPRFELTEDAKILHWLGGAKPWHPIYIEGQPLWRAQEASFARRERGKLRDAANA